MPLHSNLQLLKQHYREFLRKTAAYHRGEGGDACSHNYYVERAYAEATFDHSFAKLRQLITISNFSELRASYHARKERAKERLRHAFDAKVSRINSYLAGSRSDVKVPEDLGKAALTSEQGPTPQHAAEVSTNSQDLQQLYGTDGLLRRTVLYIVGHAARTYMTGLNTTRVEGLETMSAALQRPTGQALITVSNHVAALDDPLVVSALLPEGALERPEGVRWTLCASDRCFRYSALVPLFRAAKVLPVVRGGGLAQPGMAAAEARLAAGDWVHIFPEGTRSRDGVTLGAVRKGVGRLVAAVPPEAPPPLVVPFVHRGMEDVMPRGAVLPAVGQKIDVLVGEPIPVADLLAAARDQHWPSDRLHTAVAARVAHGLRDLSRRLEALRAGLPDPGPEAAGIEQGTSVSSLDQFDPADLALAAQMREARRRQQGAGAVSAAWDRLKFRMALQHGTWATQGVAAGAAAATPVVTAAERRPGLDVAAVDVAAAAAAEGPGSGSGVASRGLLQKVEGREVAPAGWGPLWLGLGASPSGAAGMSSASPYLRQLLGLTQRVEAGLARERELAGPGWCR